MTRGHGDRIAYSKALCRTVPCRVAEVALADPFERPGATQGHLDEALSADRVGLQHTLGEPKTKAERQPGEGGA
jgi:hypothetical protein